MLLPPPIQEESTCVPEKTISGEYFHGCDVLVRPAVGTRVSVLNRKKIAKKLYILQIFANLIISLSNLSGPSRVTGQKVLRDYLVGVRSCDPKGRSFAAI